MFREGALANLIFLLAPIAIGLIVSMLLPGVAGDLRGYAGAALAFYVIGFISSAIAKIQHIRRGHPVSFGSAQILLWQRWAYRIEHLLMVVGFLITIALTAATKLSR
jgi:hypothetical protein